MGWRVGNSERTIRRRGVGSEQDGDEQRMAMKEEDSEAKVESGREGQVGRARRGGGGGA